MNIFKKNLEIVDIVINKFNLNYKIILNKKIYFVIFINIHVCLLTLLENDIIIIIFHQHNCTKKIQI